MEPTAKVAIGSGLVSVLAAGGMLAAGVLATSAVGVLADPTAPPARAAALRPFEDCTALRSWYVQHSVDEVGPYGWGGRAWPLAVPQSRTGAAAEDSAAGVDASPSTGQPSSDTGTNTQEAGIDEPDVAKTDGRIVVRLLEGRRLVVTDVTGDTPRRLSSWRLPRQHSAQGLLLVDHHALVVAEDIGRPDGGFDDAVGAPVMRLQDEASTDLYDVDLSDPTQPATDSHTSWSGRLLSLRQYGDTVRLVSSTGLPALPFVQPRPGRFTEDEATERNRQVVHDSTIEDWLPGVDSGSTSRAVVECGEVYHPTTPAGHDTVAVSTFWPGAVERANAVAVTGAGDEVYSSADRLYVTSTDWGGTLDGWGGGKIGPEDPTTERSHRSPTRPRTHVHAFALTDDSARYVASGVLDGTIRDRWSLDEHDSHLRVALSWPARDGSTRESGIVVLAETDGALVPVGRLRGLGVGEDVQSVRWFDDLAVVVTFRQMDPLYTIDLRDPTHPRRLGALKIPGFSAYLHPLGDDRLLGLGSDATREGQDLGAQAAVFDLSDPEQAGQAAKVTFGAETTLGAAEDPHAFTWLPGVRAAITTLQRWGAADVQPRMLLLRVSPDDSLATRGLPAVGGWQQRALPLDDGRVALVGTTVKVVTIPA